MDIDKRVTPKELAEFIEDRWNGDGVPDDEDIDWMMMDIELPDSYYRIYWADFGSVGGLITEYSIRIMDDYFSCSAGVTNRSGQWEFGSTGCDKNIFDALLMIKLTER